MPFGEANRSDRQTCTARKTCLITFIISSFGSGDPNARPLVHCSWIDGERAVDTRHDLVGAAAATMTYASLQNPCLAINNQNGRPKAATHRCARHTMSAPQSPCSQ